MAARFNDWFRQAKRDLDHARRARESGDHEWACFAAQQCAEKAVKAVFMKGNREAWGHSVAALLRELPPPWQAGEKLLEAGKELDKHYIPPRYPNSYPQGAPYEYYTRDEADRAIRLAECIVTFCEGLLAGHSPSSDAA